MTDSLAPEEPVAVLLESYDAVYVEVPKVACSSIKIALAGLLGIDLSSVGGDPHSVRFPAPEWRLGEATLFPGLFSFAFVRNPWDRLVSCYRDKILGEVTGFTSFHPERGIAYCLARFDTFSAGMSFRDFLVAVADISDEVADEHFRSQHAFVTDGEGAVALDFVGRFETLDRDFRRVVQEVGLPPLSLPRVQAVRIPRPYTDFYTSETRRIVADRFRRDLDLFGYEFGGD